MDHAETRLHSIAEEFLQDRRVRRDPRSVSARRDCDGKQIYLKHADLDLSAEADALWHADQVGRHAGVGPIRLLWYDPQCNVLFTEYVDGTSLFNALWNGTSFLRPWLHGRSDWSVTLPSVCAWLARFHDHGRARGDVEACKEWLLASTNRKLAAVVKATNTGFTEEDGERIRAYLEVAMTDESWNDLPVTRIHGDLTYVNLRLATAGSVFVLDFADSRLGFALEDLVRLWSGVWELSHCGARRGRIMRPCLPAMLSAYGLEPAVCETTPFRVMRIWNAITRSCELARTAAVMDRATRRLVSKLADIELAWLRVQTEEAAPRLA